MNSLDFVVVGAQKAGTTTLHKWLAQDPRIGLPERKETHFFSSEARRARGWSWYWGSFPRGDHSVLGEVDPNYLSSPPARDRLFEAFGESLKVALVVREPSSRAISQYSMSGRRGLESRPLDEALRAELSRPLGSGPDWSDYIWRGLYATHLSYWREKFPSVLVLKYEDLFGSSTARTSYEALLQFIGLDLLKAPPIEVVANSRAISRSDLISKVVWDKSSGRLLRKLVRAGLPSSRLRYRLARTVDEWNRAEPGTPGTPSTSGTAIPPQARVIWEAETRLLEEMTGLDLSPWRVVPPTRNC